MKLGYAALFIGGGFVLSTACGNESSNDNKNADTTAGGSNSSSGGDSGGTGAKGGASATGGTGSRGGVGAGGKGNGSGGESGGAEGADDSGGAGGEGSGGSNDGVGGESYTGSCPTTLPNGEPCSAEDGPCSYGDAPRIDCRDRSACVDGIWANTMSECGPPSAPSQCPSAPPSESFDCETVDQTCYYATGEDCLCINSITANIWICNPPLAGVAGCPPTVPNAGADCEGTPSCDYGCGPLSESSVLATCAGSGEWQLAMAPCSVGGGG